MTDDLATILDFIAIYEVKCAARRLKQFGRIVAHRRATKLSTTWVKFRLHVKDLCGHIRACNRIGAVYYIYRLKCLFTKHIWAVKKIQAYQRVSIAKERVRKIKFPYGDLSFNEMGELSVKKHE